MKNRLICLPALCALVLASCATRPAGDATVYGEGAAAFARLPEFPIGQRGTFEFAVKDIGFATFPRLLEIRTRPFSGSEFPDVPFDEAVVKVDLLTPDGREVASRAFPLVRWRTLGTGRFENPLWDRADPLPGLPDDYRVRATVLEPSFRRWDKAEIVLSRRG